MAQYPAEISTFRSKENLPNQPYDETKKTTIFMEDFKRLEDELKAVQEFLGVTTFGHPLVTESYYFYNLLDKIYFVGCIWIGTNGFHPGERYGVGEWIPYAEGSVIAGKTTTGEFSNVGSVIGSNTKILTQANLPSGITGSFSHHGDENGSLMRNPTGVFSGIAKTSYKAPPGSTAGSSSVQGMNFNLGGQSTPISVVQQTVPVYCFLRVS